MVLVNTVNRDTKGAPKRSGVRRGSEGKQRERERERGDTERREGGGGKGGDVRGRFIMCRARRMVRARCTLQEKEGPERG